MIPLFHVDAFSDRPFAGNPAAVCLLSGPAEEGWMQAVAQEMNLSETAFLVQEGDVFRLRWFTPAVEVDLCGHATLASAHVLWEPGRLGSGEQARFYTRSGLLTARRQGAWIELNFPAQSPQPVPAPPGLLDALGVPARPVYRAQTDYLVEVDSEACLRDMRPDSQRLAAIAARGVMVTARADRAGCDFVSRFFAPSVGIPEDPVTGSAHCALTPYWAERLGKDEMVAYQASTRGGIVRVRLLGDRVDLAGQAVTVARGELTGR